MRASRGLKWENKMHKLKRSIIFVSSKRRRPEARNFAVIFIFIPFTTYEKTSFTE